VIVLDASAVIDWLLQTAVGRQIDSRLYSRGESLHAPHLLDLEVAQVLRRLVREAAVSVPRADQAIQDLLDLRVTRYPHFVFLHTFGGSGIICRPTMPAYVCAHRKTRRHAPHP